MKILEITDITRKENFIYYRREFFGQASYDLPGKKTLGRIEFTIETAPTGKKDIHIKLLDPIDYPTLPIMKDLKEIILAMDNDGKLP